MVESSLKQTHSTDVLGTKTDIMWDRLLLNPPGFAGRCMARMNYENLDLAHFIKTNTHSGSLELTPDMSIWFNIVWSYLYEYRRIQAENGYGEMPKVSKGDLVKLAKRKGNLLYNGSEYQDIDDIRIAIAACNPVLDRRIQVLDKFVDQASFLSSEVGHMMIDIVVGDAFVLLKIPPEIQPS